MRNAINWMLRSVALVRTAVSEERSVSISVTRISESGTMLAVTSNRSTLRRHSVVFLRSVLQLLIVPSAPILVTLMIETICFSEALALTGATRRNIPENCILDSHCRGSLISYNIRFVFLLNIFNLLTLNWVYKII
jgi:hypothetical protein